jgi:hypothetical protein
MNPARLLAALALSTVVVSAHAREPSPCRFLPEGLVRSAFSIPASQALHVREGASCRWELAGTAAAQGVAFNFSRPLQVTSATIDALFARLRDGMKREVAGRTVRIAPKKVRWVDGAGDKAFWNSDQQQLAVSAKGRLFYVTVTLDGADDAAHLAGALTIARAVVDVL